MHWSNSTEIRPNRRRFDERRRTETLRQNSTESHRNENIFTERARITTFRNTRQNSTKNLPENNFFLAPSESSLNPLTDEIVPQTNTYNHRYNPYSSTHQQ